MTLKMPIRDAQNVFKSENHIVVRCLEMANGDSLVMLIVAAVIGAIFFVVLGAYLDDFNMISNSLAWIIALVIGFLAFLGVIWAWSR